MQPKQIKIKLSLYTNTKKDYRELSTEHESQ